MSPTCRGRPALASRPRPGAEAAQPAPAPRRHRWTLATLWVALALSPKPAVAYKLLRERAPFGQAKTAPFVAPGRLFQAEIGPPWQQVPLDPKEGDTVQWRLDDNEGSALFRVHRRQVGEGAQARQLAVKAREERLKKLPHFILLEERDLMLAGIKARRVTGTFWYQGNAQYPRTVEEVFMIFGHDAFELHFECFSPAGPHLAPLLDHIYQTFQPRPSAEAPPARTDDDDDAIETDDIPF